MMANKEIIIPYELMDLNTYINNNRANRMKGAKSKRAFTRLCALSVKAAMNQGLEIKEDEMPIDLHFKWYVPNRKKDKDNIAFGKKFILDGMLQAKLIENDGWKQIGNFTDTFVVDKENPRVVVKIEGVNE